MYTTLEEAKEEVWKRWNDAKLRQRVEAYLGGSVPEFFKDKPRAVLFRNIISPNLEYLRFRELADEIGLEPLGLEYLEDPFCTRSTDKLMLAKLRIFKGRDKNGAAITRCEKIIDIKASDNLPFREIQTVWGENLVDFHRALTREYDGRHEVFDLSGWIHAQSANALENYRKFFALFTCFGVLLENFVTNAAESDFAAKVVHPAFSSVRTELGISPLVVPIYSDEELEDVACWCYPGSAMDVVKVKRGGVKKRLLRLFSRYCRSCKGGCCKEEEEVTVFKTELERFPLSKDKLTFIDSCGECGELSANGNVERISIVAGCPFLQEGKGCNLAIDVKPLDCLTYPVYPLLDYGNGTEKKIVGMMVHKSCLFAESISGDNELLDTMRGFWEQELAKIDGADLRQWFGETNSYWEKSRLILR